MGLRTLAGLALIIATITEGNSMAQSGNQPPNPGTSMQRARPGDIAEFEELQAARRAGTRAAYDLFLARHPSGRHAAEARAEQARIPQ